MGAMPFTPEQYRWAEALEVEQEHGANAAIYAAGRVKELAQALDMTGMDRWTEIYQRLVWLAADREQVMN
jgi:hypothetical protein